METLEHLQRREQEGKPIIAGLVGCGQMGSGMVHVTSRMAGMDTKAVADLDPNRAIAALTELGVTESGMCVTNQANEAEDALRAGKYIVTEDALLLTRLEGVDVVVEATGFTEVGAQVAWNCIQNQKHVVMLNAETDSAVGPLLARTARKMGCVYTVAMGDEPGVCKMLYNFSRILGFEVVCLGKGKNNVIDHYATPESCRAEAESKAMNPKMLAAFKDGTKTMVEMSIMSNATGLVPDVPGAHGAKVEIEDLARVLCPEEDGGILSQRGCVEYSTGKVAPGVFAIIATDDPHIMADLKFYSMGDGPYYLLYRPYHLCNIETPLSIAEAVIYGEATLVSQAMVSEVVPVAKRDLKAGERVGDIGSPDIFNLIYRYDEASQKRAIPMGVVPGATVIKDIPKGELLTQDNTAPDTTTLVYKLRQLQDEMFSE